MLNLPENRPAGTIAFKSVAVPEAVVESSERDSSLLLGNGHLNQSRRRILNDHITINRQQSMENLANRNLLGSMHLNLGLNKHQAYFDKLKEISQSVAEISRQDVKE